MTQQIINYEASVIDALLDAEGTATLILATDKGRVAVGCQRDVLERLGGLIAEQLQRVPAPSGRRTKG
jgi:hypothetical protein